MVSTAAKRKRFVEARMRLSSTKPCYDPIQDDGLSIRVCRHRHCQPCGAGSYSHYFTYLHNGAKGSHLAFPSELRVEDTLVCFVMLSILSSLRDLAVSVFEVIFSVCETTFNFIISIPEMARHIVKGLSEIFGGVGRFVTGEPLFLIAMNNCDNELSQR